MDVRDRVRRRQLDRLVVGRALVAARQRARQVRDDDARRRTAPPPPRRPRRPGAAERRSAASVQKPASPRPTARGKPRDQEEEVAREVAQSPQSLPRSAPSILPGESLTLRNLSARPLRYVVDDQRDALERVLLAHPVLEVIGPVARDQPPVVDLDRDPRRRGADLRRVVAGAGACPASTAARAARPRRRRTGSASESGSAPRGGRPARSRRRGASRRCGRPSPRP